MIYLDVDGVLANFDQGLINAGIPAQPYYKSVPRSEWTLEQVEEDKRVVFEMTRPGFFRNLPLMDDAKELWNFAAPFRPVVLTARPGLETRGVEVAAEKRAWIEEHFGKIEDDQFICCLRSEKQNFIGHTPHPHQILVDDMVENIEAWNKEGGIGIVHQSAEMSIYQLKMILNV